MTHPTRPRSAIACALMLALSVQAAGCAFETASAPESPAARTESSVGESASSSHHPTTLGSTYPARSIWTASVDGDYLVTPLMIEGGDRVHFIGG